MAIAEAEIKAGTRLTEEQFLRLPDDGRKYELVDGEAKEVPTGWRHDEISINLLALLLPFARRRGKMSSGQTGFRMTDENVRAPDVSYTRNERIPGGRTPVGFGGVAPDLCVEIISPSEDTSDMARKVGEYFASGTEQVWLVEPQSQQVTVYRSLMNPRTFEAQDELDGGDMLPGFWCRVAELFTLS